jgi:ribosome-associated protein
MTKTPHLSLSVGERPINLTQVLKLANCAQSGGEAKSLIAEGLVKVNGEVELRKRRQMKVGDTVVLQDGPTIVLIDGGPGEG